MEGWKTKVGAIGSIASGVVLICQALVTIEDGQINFDRIQEGVVLIAAGLAVWGIGHKIEKGAKAQPVKKT